MGFEILLSFFSYSSFKIRIVLKWVLIIHNINYGHINYFFYFFKETLMLAPEFVDDGKCPNFTTAKVTRNNTCIIPKYIALT